MTYDTALEIFFEEVKRLFCFFMRKKVRFLRLRACNRFGFMV